MKKKLSVLVLIMEIAAISILHAVKIARSEKNTQESIVSRYSNLKDTKLKPTFIFTRLEK